VSFLPKFFYILANKKNNMATTHFIYYQNMTHQTSKIAIDYLFNYINQLPPSINIKEFLSKKSDTSRARLAIMKHYYYQEYPNPHDIEAYNRKTRKMSKETLFKLGYIYLRLITILEYGDCDDYQLNESWFIRQVMAAMKNFNNPDFKEIDLKEIFNTYDEEDI